MTQDTASNYKLCYSSNIQNLFELLRKQNDGDVILSTGVAESLAALEMTLKRWKTPTGFYTVLKYVKSPLQTMYSTQNVTQQLAQDLVHADTVADADTPTIPNATIQDRGLFRSIILNDVGNIVAFSPPKTITFNHLADSPTLDQSLSMTSAFEIEEFVEGTMINLFYNSNVVSKNASSSEAQVIAGWEMSTKGAVGGSIFVPAPNTSSAASEKIESLPPAHKDTFRALFLDACIANGIEFDKLDTRYCYSLVLQHPKNPLICHITKPRLYLIAVYSINNETLTVTRHPRSTIDWKNIGFNVPRSYDRPATATATITTATTTTTTTAATATSFQAVRTRYADPNGSTPYRIMGVMFNARNGAGWSFKLRNPTYETAKHTPSDSGKRHLFEYCNLRRTHDIATHLNQFPDDDAAFKGFQSRIVAYTRLLYSSYIECFITKKQPLIDYAAHLRTHMYRIHNDIYKPRKLATANTPLADAKTKVGVKFQDAVQYVNLVMTPTELFHALLIV
jgi:hypothetical protein